MLKQVLPLALIILLALTVFTACGQDFGEFSEEDLLGYWAADVSGEAIYQHATIYFEDSGIFTVKQYDYIDDLQAWEVEAYFESNWRIARGLLIFDNTWGTEYYRVEVLEDGVILTEVTHNGRPYADGHIIHLTEIPFGYLPPAPDFS